MTYSRPIFNRHLSFLTRRCSERRFFMRPGKRINQAVLYALGYASQVHNVELHWFIAMSNHHHLGVTDHFGNLTTFYQRFHELVAKSLNVHWGRWESLWAASEQTLQVSCEAPEDVFAAMIYSLTNPVKDNLVEKAHHWPGATSLGLAGREITVRRPHWFYDPDGDMPSTVTLRFTRPSAFRHMSRKAWDEKVRCAVEDVEAKALRERRKTGRRVMGRKAVLMQSAFDSPNTHAPRRQLNPRVAAKNKWRRIEALRRNKLWLEVYQRAHAAYRAGDRDAVFPHGTYAMRVLHGVTCAPAL